MNRRKYGQPFSTWRVHGMVSVHVRWTNTAFLQWGTISLTRSLLTE